MKDIFRAALLMCGCAVFAAAQQTATIVGCKPNTGVRLYKHFLSVRAYHRLACGSTVEILNSSPGKWANVRQGEFEGYIQPWHINLDVTNAEPHHALRSLLQSVANGLYAYGRAIQDPRTTLAQDCIRTPGCTLQLAIGDSWQTVTQAPADVNHPMRVNVEGSNYNVLAPPLPTSWAIPGLTQPSSAADSYTSSEPSQPAIVLQGDTTSLMIVNGYAYRLEQDGKWHPLGLGEQARPAKTVE